MGRPPVDRERLRVAWEAIQAGATQAEACRRAGISLATWRRNGKMWLAEEHRRVALGFERDGIAAAAQMAHANKRSVAAPDAGDSPYEAAAKLTKVAKEALEDFGLFRRRYLGRVAVGWQIDAANKIVAHLETPDRSFLLLNVPPGAGKSTLWHDIAVWLICRDRTIRILIVSATGKLAKGYSERIKTTLERRMVYRAPAKLKKRGLAVDAEGSLVEDFGRFRPMQTGLWRRDEFTVEQEDGEPLDSKEPTVAAYGLDEEFIGFRADLVLCDDVATIENSKDGLARDKMIERWESVVEERVEPGGCLALVGQRLGPLDLYAYCKAKEKADGDDEYEQYVYPAHDEARCQGHEAGQPIKESWPESCLIDANRLTWSRLESIALSKPERYRIVYQQEDAYEGARLVQKVWVEGGLGTDGVLYPGCYDKDRPLGQVPVGLAPPVLSVAQVDPSGEAYWAVEWFLRQPDMDLRWLVDAEWKRMSAEELLGYDTVRRVHTGLMDAWQRRSVEAGHPITHWVVEVNAAQRYLLAHDFVRQWMRQWRVQIIPHTTGRNKLDENLGVEGLLPQPFRSGSIRLPYAPWDTRRRIVDEFVNQHVEWTADRKKRTDMVMANWFGELAEDVVRRPKLPPRQWRPSWLREPRRGAA